MSFAPFFMSDEEEDARLALQDTDIGAISPTFSNLTPPTMSPDQLPTPELERLAAMEQLGQFGQPQVDYSQIPDYYGQAQEAWAQANPDRGQIQPGSYVLDAMAAKIPQGVKDFEPTTFMSTGQTSGLPGQPSLGNLAQFALPQSGEELPFEFLPFDELFRYAPDAFEAMVKAFHGTRRSAADDILKRGFRPEALRSGTGGQAQGAGYYFAEKKGVAGSYQKLVGADDTRRVTYRGKMVDGLPADVTDPLELEAIDILMDRMEVEDLAGGGGLQDFIDGFIDDAADDFEWSPEHTRKVRETYERVAKDLSWNELEMGALLDVDLDVDPEDLLDWDAPLSEQPPKVREALERVGVRSDVNPIAAASPLMSGEPNGRMLYERLAREVGDKEAAAAALREAGIPGVAYLDGNSRGGKFTYQVHVRTSPADGAYLDIINYPTKEEAVQAAKDLGGEFVEKAGTRNIVIFPGGEDLIHPKKIDGKAIAKGAK